LSGLDCQAPTDHVSDIECYFDNAHTSEDNEMAAEPQVPSFDKLMWPAICALKQMGGSASHQELLDKVIELAQIPEDIQNISHTGGRESRVGYNLRWAQSYLGKYGALENTARGVWAPTAKGRRLKETDIKEAVRKMSQVKRRSGDGVAEPEETHDAGAGWKDDLIGVVQGMTADGFERLCQRILRESGLLKVEVTGRSGDGGIDGVGVLRIGAIVLVHKDRPPVIVPPLVIIMEPPPPEYFENEVAEESDLANEKVSSEPLRDR
jgi:hypothetical protein